MQVRQDAYRCDPQTLNSYLDDLLDEDQVDQVEEHLSSCPHCRRQLAQAAGSQHDWQRAEALLPEDDLDRMTLESGITNGIGEVADRDEAAMLSREIRGWLDPTDDPQSLGRFAGYEIVGIVGHGGMGIVLKGFEASLNRFVAIKVLAPRLATNGSARQRFAREAQAAAAVRHDNVIAIHRVDEWHGLPFLVMPYVRGVSLQARIDSEGPLSIEQTLRVGAQIASGLAAAHAQGLVHRDIKPANILLEQGVERVTITDFGLARAADDASVTRTGVIAGTPQYMSPEQAQAKSLDSRSDLFSLGSVLYAMVAGRPPFRGGNGLEVLQRIVHQPARPIREIASSAPDWFADLIAQLHAKAPAQRPQSAEELAATLRACLAHLHQPQTNLPPSTIKPLPPSEKQPSKDSSRTSSRNIHRGAMIMLATAAMGFLSLLVWQSSSPPDIAGKWSGERIRSLEIRPVNENRMQFEGVYAGGKGQVDLKWSRLERRFNGRWKGPSGHGKISVRLVNGQIRGAWTTAKGNGAAQDSPPKLSDLVWNREMSAPLANSQGRNEIEFAPDARTPSYRGGSQPPRSAPSVPESPASASNVRPPIAAAPSVPDAPPAESRVRPPIAAAPGASGLPPHHLPGQFPPDTPAAFWPEEIEGYPSSRPIVLTPKQVVASRDKYRKKHVFVRFKVTTVVTAKAVGPQGSVKEHWKLNTEAADFSIDLARNVTDRLRQLGVFDIVRHYRNRTLEVRGILVAIPTDLISKTHTTWTYVITVQSLDHLRFVDPVPTPTDAAPKNPLSEPVDYSLGYDYQGRLKTNPNPPPGYSPRNKAANPVARPPVPIDPAAPETPAAPIDPAAPESSKAPADPAAIDPQPVDSPPTEPSTSEAYDPAAPKPARKPAATKTSGSKQTQRNAPDYNESIRGLGYAHFDPNGDPAEVIAALKSLAVATAERKKEVSLRLRILAVHDRVQRSSGSEAKPDKTWVLMARGSNNGAGPRSFQIRIAPSVANQLASMGVKDIAQHFLSKTIEVKTSLPNTKADAKVDKPWHGIIMVSSVDQIRFVKAEPGAF